mmetsp:Transcript_17997/g.48405  ORF Transcript_17997/g.48405 Transcript_17997/m.48405 type:complete len:480 (-) Transcript_17997:403-1842(-)
MQAEPPENRSSDGSDSSDNDRILDDEDMMQAPDHGRLPLITYNNPNTIIPTPGTGEGVHSPDERSPALPVDRGTCLLHMLEDPQATFGDTALVFDDGDEVVVHRVIINSRPVFQSLPPQLPRVLVGACGDVHLSKEDALAQVHAAYGASLADRPATRAYLHSLLAAPESALADGLLIAADGSEFHVHRCMLAANCDFFRACFAHAQREGRTDAKLPCEDLPSRLVPLLLAAIYTGHDEERRILASEDLNGDMLAVADQLLLPELKEACETVLVQRIDATRAPTLLLAAVTGRARRLHEACMQFIIRNLDEVSRAPDYALLTPPVQAILKQLRSAMNKNPLCPGACLTDPDELLAVLREAYVQQQERLIESQQRQAEEKRRSEMRRQGEHSQSSHLSPYLSFARRDHNRGTRLEDAARRLERQRTQMDDVDRKLEKQREQMDAVMHFLNSQEKALAGMIRGSAELSSQGAGMQRDEDNVN